RAGAGAAGAPAGPTARAITGEVLPMSAARRSGPGEGETAEATSAAGVGPVQARQSAGSSQSAWGSRPSRTRSTAHLGQPSGHPGAREPRPRGIAQVTAVSPLIPG